MSLFHPFKQSKYGAGASDDACQYPQSYYAATANRHEGFEPLRSPIRADVCVIGGGFTGISAALHLAEQGVDVVLIEANRLGWGASGRNGGQCANGQRLAQDELKGLLGEEWARQLWDMGLEAVALVSKLIHRFDIQCHLKTGILQLARKRQDALWYQKYARLLQADYGHPTHYLDGPELSKVCGSEQFAGGLLDEASLHLHPLNYMLGLAGAAQSLGVKIFEHTPALRYDRASPTSIDTPFAEIKAEQVVLACNGYLGHLERRVAGKIMPINNFMLATAPLSPLQQAALNPNDWAMHDSRFVVNYWKLSGEGRLLFGGGETYGRRFPADLKRFVQRYMLNIYPMLEDVPIDYAWGGTLAVTRTRLPSLGCLSPALYYAHGFSGHGVPTATFAGKLIAEAITGSVQRFDRMASLPVGSFPGGTFLRWPLLVLGMLYYSLRDRL